MGLLNSLFSLFSSAAENAVSAPSDNTVVTNSVEAKPQTAQKTASTTAKNSDGLITEYVFDGEVKVGTQIKVEPLEWLFITKDGNVVYVIQEGVYVINEANLPKFTNSICYTVKLLESNKFRWGTNEPIAFTDNNCCELSLRVFGEYRYKICDPVRVLTDYINADDNFSISDYTKNLVIDAFKKTIQNYNGCSCTQLPTKDICNAIKEELVPTGFDFRIEIQMIKPTEKSMAAIEQAMQNKILNNL